MTQVHSSHVSNMQQLQPLRHRSLCGTWIDRALHGVRCKCWANLPSFRGNVSDKVRLDVS